MRIYLPLLLGSIILSPLTSAIAQTKANDYTPEIHGTIRTKYEYEPQIHQGRFEIRNARVSVEGKVIPIVGYKAEIDLSDEGSIKMLDAYVRLQPSQKWKFTFGQMRVPFTIDAHRSPHLQYFANRSFIAKQVGNVRDVGAAASYSFGNTLPITLEGGVFNGSGLTNQKDFWTDTYNFSFKASTLINDRFNITASCQKTLAGKTDIMMYDIGSYWQNKRWHIEAEYLRKYYLHADFSPVNAVDAFAAYILPINKGLKAITFLGRYDYMSNHSKGAKEDNGDLTTDDPKRHRITGGLTFSLGKGNLQADIRCNYEQYFYTRGVTPAISEQNKIVLEFVAHF